MQKFLVPVLVVLLSACASAHDGVTQDVTTVRNAAATYPEQARRQGIEGVVMLRVHILASGRAGAVQVASSSGNGLLDAAAVDAATRSVYRPAQTASGQKVDSWVRIPYRFVLE